MTPFPAPEIRTPENALLLELAGASIVMSADEFEDYAKDRLAPMIADRDPEYLTTLLILAAALTGESIVSWAEDTERTPQELLHAIRGEMNNQEGH